MTDLLSSPVPGAGGDLRPDWSWLEGTAPDADALGTAQEGTATLLADHGVTYGDDDRWRLDPAPVIVRAAEWAALDRALVQRAELLDAVLRDLYGPRRLLTDALLPPAAVLSHPGFLRAVDGVRLPWSAGQDDGRELVLTATDVVRDGDGAWCAVSDRAQAPSGAGYAMEDRRVVAQVLAGPYRQAPIARLGPFFHALRLALHDVAPHLDGPRSGRHGDDERSGEPRDEPRAVLLTAGPASETAFDQAYLAAMLGLPLVQGTDLVVRSGRLWMRGLEGLEPVDVVLRRVDAQWCDPLDLTRESRLGVPGLVRAVRAGTVSVVNPLGASVLESPALAAYLPRLARAVLGTDLALPSAPTWWCGEPTHLAHVLSRLDRLLLLPTAPEPGAPGSPSQGLPAGAIAGWTLDAAEREQLADEIRQAPWAWTGQEPVGPNHGHPVVGPHHGHPVDADAGADGWRAAVLRTFAVAHAGSYQVMAGGLARVWSPTSDESHAATRLDQVSEGPVVPAALVSSALGAVAKDVWVLAPSAAPPGPDDETARPAPHGEPERAPAGISPRAAENLYWMGRYAERAEAQTRLLRAVVDRWDDYRTGPQAAGGHALHVLLRTVVRHDDDGHALPLPTLRDLVHDATAPRSIAYAVDRLADAAQAVRDLLSTDTFGPLARIDRALADARLEPAQAAEPTSTDEDTDRGTALPPSSTVASSGDPWDVGVTDPSDAVAALVREGTATTSGLRPVLDTVLESLLAVAGIVAEGLTRDAGWRFLDAGRRIERAQHVVDTLAATAVRAGPPEVDRLVFEAVLEVHESTITYRRRYPTTAVVPGLLDLLLHDRTNPRSLAFSTDRLRDDLRAVPVPSRLGSGTDQRDHLLQGVADLETELDGVVADVVAVSRVSGGPVGGRRERLAESLDSMRWRLRAAHEEIARLHFQPTAPQHTQPDLWGRPNVVLGGGE